MTTLTVTVAIATPILAFLGTILGHAWTRRTALELDRWRKREETMRLLRWGTELAVDTERGRSMAGLTVLDALLDSPLLDQDDVDFVGTVSAGVVLYVAPSP